MANINAKIHVSSGKVLFVWF